MIHFYLTRDEKAALRVVRGSVLCGEKEGEHYTRDWKLVTCQRCIHTGMTWRVYNGGG